MSTHSNSGELKLCTHCIGDKDFVKWIKAHGRRGKCDFDISHGKSRKVVAVSDFAEEVDRYFRENYGHGGEYMYTTRASDNPSYDTRGEPYKEILGNDLQADGDLVDAIAENLPDCNHADIMDGAEPFYDESSNYESLADAKARDDADEAERWYERRFEYQWNDFCHIVQYERRFFKTKELLDELFGKPEEYDQGTIRPVYALEIGQKIYRARLLDDGFTEAQLNQNPAKELGAPPREKARAGRMSVEYIPAFYGAFSEETAVSEIRPGIGEQVAVGEFDLLKPLRVFDFTAFSRSRGEPWNESYAHTRYDFITQMQDEISKPILPFERQREYIATQIVAEYLREYFNCDAIIYKSSMHKSDKDDNQNIVILNRGVDFIGPATTSSLALSRHNIRHIMNVSYEISPIWF
jgi:RES domain-containing protein